MTWIYGRKEFNRKMEKYHKNDQMWKVLGVVVYEEYLFTYLKLIQHWKSTKQGGRSWRASGDRQISLNASAERAFANFRDKKHRILQFQIFAT